VYAVSLIKREGSRECRSHNSEELWEREREWDSSKRCDFATFRNRNVARSYLPRGGGQGGNGNGNRNDGNATFHLVPGTRSGNLTGTCSPEFVCLFVCVFG